MRLMSDLKSVCSDPIEGASAAPANEDDLFAWDATIFGPEECIWEGGIFPLKLVFSEDYPSRPPKVRFTFPVFHPNVYGDGTLCLDIIQDKWKPIYNVSTILISIRSLLTDPNIDSPANPTAAALFRDNPKEYKKRVRQCVERSQESTGAFL
uniref:UBC core domain-containing protein n=1 Tax=Arcella intermedia TaxID=1963864 RepID=A0A6B2LP87_9EUKA